MKKSVYLETSVISYLAGRQTRDILIVARQEITKTWWDARKDRFSVYISRQVLEEISKGDKDGISNRMEYVKMIPLLDESEEAIELAEFLIGKRIIPRKCVEDALHISLAAVNGIDYLLTWNFKHIANAAIRKRITDAIMEFGYEGSIICTPEELI